MWLNKGTTIQRKSVFFNPPTIHPSWWRWWAVGEEAEAPPQRELQSRSCDCSGGAMDFSHFCRRLYRVKLRCTRKVYGTVSLLHTILYSLFVGGPLRRAFFINFTGFVADLRAFKGEEQQVSQCALVATNNK